MKTISIKSPFLVNVDGQFKIILPCNPCSAIENDGVTLVFHPTAGSFRMPTDRLDKLRAERTIV